MKEFVKEYFRVIMYTICGVLIVLGSYNILININHAIFLNKKVIVSDIDINYKAFKENVLKIENNIELYKSSSFVNKIKDTLLLIKQDGIYELLPGDKLGYMDLYKLNNYFIDMLINNGWVANLKLVKRFDNDINNEFINNLIVSSNYVNKELLNNSNFHYDVRNNDIRNDINEEYQLILNNYKEFSYIVLEMSNEMGDNNA